LSKKKFHVGKLNREDYQLSGLFPIVDQGLKEVAGWTSNASLVYDGPLPAVVFGDHTRALKLVEEPFVAGADGVKVLVPDPALFDPQFFYFALRALDIPARGYNRHFAVLKEQTIFAPPLSEQRTIAHVLSTIQRAREAARNALAAARTLEASLLGHLMDVEGADSEGWRVVSLGALLKATQYGLSLRGGASGTVPILRMTNIADGQVTFTDLQYVSLTEAKSEPYLVSIGDLLFNRTNSAPLVGKTGLVGEPTRAVFASYLIRLRCDTAVVEPSYLNWLLNWEPTQERVRGLATRGVSQSNVSASKLRALEVAIPPLVFQRRIANAMDSARRLVTSYRDLGAALDLVFHASLADLVDGRRTVAA
jgi:type I restriction enzyme S subunit